MPDLFSDDMLKRCPYCGRKLERTQYNRSRFTADGLQAYCKDCQRAYRSKHPKKEYKWFHNDTQTLRIWP